MATLLYWWPLESHTNFEHVDNGIGLTNQQSIHHTETSLWDIRTDHTDSLDYSVAIDP